MFRLGLVDTLVTHANKEGFGLTPLSGDRRCYNMPPLLKIKQKQGAILVLEPTPRRNTHWPNSRSAGTHHTAVCTSWMSFLATGASYKKYTLTQFLWLYFWLIFRHLYQRVTAVQALHKWCSGSHYISLSDLFHKVHAKAWRQLVI